MAWKMSLGGEIKERNKKSIVYYSAHYESIFLGNIGISTQDMAPCYVKKVTET